MRVGHSIAGTAGVARCRDQNFVSYLQNPTFWRWIPNHQSFSKIMLVTGVDQSSYRDWCRYRPSPKLQGKIILWGPNGVDGQQSGFFYKKLERFFTTLIAYTSVIPRDRSNHEEHSISRNGTYEEVHSSGMYCTQATDHDPTRSHIITTRSAHTWPSQIAGAVCAPPLRQPIPFILFQQNAND